MRKLLTFGIVLFVTGGLLNSCSNEKVKFEEPSQGLVDSLSLSAMQEFGDSVSPISRPQSRGLQWKIWETWFTDCPQNATFKKNIVYLGTASSKGLGFILSKDNSMNRQDFSKICTDTSLYKQFFDYGVVNSQCDLSKMSDFSIDMMIDGDVLKTVNADLGAYVKKHKKITVNTGGWRIESILTTPFLDYLDSSKNPAIQRYRDDLLNKNNVVLSKVLKVYGFSADIETADSISTGLKATLQNGFNVNVIPVDSAHKIGFSLKFTRTSSNIISVSSTGEFSLFGQASKAKKL